MRTIHGAILMFVAMASHGCGNHDSTSTLTISTYNVGMARGYVDHSAERFEQIKATLSGEDGADVVCLQELWSDDDTDSLIEHVETTYPYAFRRVTTLEEVSDTADMAPGCTQVETAPLVACAVPLCDGEADLASCVLGSCEDEFNNMSIECQGCAAQNIMLGSVPLILEACVAGEGDLYGYDGRNGLALLSKKPITQQRFVRLPSFLTIRGILFAEVGGATVACAHLGSNMDEPAYGGEHASYEAENEAHVRLLLQAMDEVPGGHPTIVVGDLNNGPTVGADIQGDFVANFDLFNAAGFTHANRAALQTQCTWCAENPLAGTSSSFILDHVMVKNADVLSARRIFDEAIEVAKEDGELVETRLSDHYGVEATLQLD